MANDRLFGRAFIRLDGMTLASLPGTGKINPGGVERTPVVGDAGFLGFTEKPVHGEIECDIAISSDTDVDKINKTTGASVTFECDSGQVYVMRRAAMALPAPVQSGDGKASLKFIGTATVQT